MATSEKINIKKILKSSAQIFAITKTSCTTKDGQIIANQMVYMAAALAGISCAIAARAAAGESGEPLSESTTDCGRFFFGAPIDALLFDTNYSVYQMICADHDSKIMPPVPNLEEIKSAVEGAVGGADAKVWNNTVSPYAELPHILRAYGSVEELVRPLEMTLREVQIAYAHALVMTIRAAYACFPKEVNCIADSIYTAFFYAHMDA